MKVALARMTCLHGHWKHADAMAVNDKNPQNEIAVMEAALVRLPSLDGALNQSYARAESSLQQAA